MKLSHLIIALLCLILAKINFAAEAEKELLPLAQTDGLSQYELQRIFADWGEITENSKIHRLSKSFRPPSGPSLVSIIYDCTWNGSTARYESKELRLELRKKSYSGELLDEELKNERHKCYLDQGATIEVDSKLTQADCMYLSRNFPSSKEVKFNDSSIPLKLIWPQVTYAYSPEKGLYILRLGVGYSGESYHLRIKRETSENVGTFTKQNNDTVEELELIHKTGLPII